MTYCRTAALAAGHPPGVVDDMPVGDVERLAVYMLSHGGVF